MRFSILIISSIAVSLATAYASPSHGFNVPQPQKYEHMMERATIKRQEENHHHLSRQGAPFPSAKAQLDCKAKHYRSMARALNKNAQLYTSSGDMGGAMAAHKLSNAAIKTAHAVEKYRDSGKKDDQTEMERAINTWYTDYHAYHQEEKTRKQPAGTEPITEA